ncbi:MAG: nucleotidyltransferase domain-containing protein [Candidatus Riflebacteria bacterium]
MLEKNQLELGRDFVKKSFNKGKILLVGVTGSHFYGFPAPDSDLDLKGIHAAPTREILALEKPSPAQNVEQMWQNTLCDFSSNELEQALKLLLKGNGNMLERIFTPFQLFETEEAGQLKSIKEAYLSKRFFHHYSGFFQRKCNEFLNSDRFLIKPLLYIYRVALTGIHLLQTGEIIGDVRKLAPNYGFEEVFDLIKIYSETSEKKCLDENSVKPFVEKWPALEKKLEDTHASSPLPDEPPGVQKCSDWMVEVRLKNISQ